MQAFGLTDIGKIRQLNQDYIFVSKESIGNLPNLFIVADGMGGHNAGEFASKYATENLISVIKESTETNPVALLNTSIEKCNKNLIEKAAEDEKLKGMGTTLVLATIYDNKMYVANVGDSRLYIINDEIKQITKDHSLVAEMVRIGEIDEKKARSHPDKNIITRAIGAFDKVDVDIFEIILNPKDIVLLCSDGLTNMIEDSEINRIINKQKATKTKVKKLIETANNYGGKDNIAVIIIEPDIDEVKEWLGKEFLSETAMR